MDEGVFENILNIIRTVKDDHSRKRLKLVREEIERTAQAYNMGGIDSIKKLLNHLIVCKPEAIKDIAGLMALVKFIVHNPRANNDYLVTYSLLSLSSLGV
jgi:hypothetical protein